MKKALVVLAVALITLVASVAMAGISGTKHDLDSVAGGITTELCAYCHTPHFAADASVMKPLWNRTTGSSTFTMYGPTARGTAVPGAMGATSRACMSCHDGATGVNNILNVPGSGLGVSNNNLPVGVAPLNTSNATNLGTDMRNDHPVSITYNTANALNAPNGTSTDGVIRVNWAGVALSGLSGSDEIECVSCHDPHVSAPAMFLRTTNASSALCLVCHNK